MKERESERAQGFKNPWRMTDTLKIQVGWKYKKLEMLLKKPQGN